MKKTVLALLAIIGVALTGCVTTTGTVGEIDQTSTAEFIIESAAMALAWDMRNDFEWTADVEKYCQAIMAGQVTSDGANAIVNYFSAKYPPLIVNRVVKLASMLGLGVDGTVIVSIDGVDIGLLQAAASGFRKGIELK